MCSGCCLMWLFYRYFYKFSGVICELGNTFPVFQHSWSWGCVCPLPELLWQCWCELQSCSPQSQVRRGTSTASSRLFPHSQSCPCTGSSPGAAAIASVPVLTKTWHYPQPQLAELLCDLPQRDTGSGRELCAQICFGLGFLLVFT